MSWVASSSPCQSSQSILFFGLFSTIPRWFLPISHILQDLCMFKSLSPRRVALVSNRVWTSQDSIGVGHTSVIRQWVAPNKSKMRVGLKLLFPSISNLLSMSYIRCAPRRKLCKPRVITLLFYASNFSSICYCYILPTFVWARHSLYQMNDCTTSKNETYGVIGLIYTCSINIYQFWWLEMGKKIQNRFNNYFGLTVQAPKTFTKHKYDGTTPFPSSS